MSTTPIDHAARLHALCAPSSGDRWIACPGSVAMEADEPDSDSDASRDGTITHELINQWGATGVCPPALLDDAERHERASVHVQFVADAVAQYKAAGAHRVTVQWEVPLPLLEVTGERNASGTVDTLILAEFADYAEVSVIDYKDGYTPVSKDTWQLKVYALCAIARFGLLQNITQLHLSIVQPRVADPATVTYTAEEAAEWSELVYGQAQLALQIMRDGPATALSHLKMTEKGCHWCRAKAKCPEYCRAVHDTVFGEFQDIAAQEALPLDESTFDGSASDFEALLPSFMDRVPMVEAWCKAVRAKVERTLLAGRPVAGYKLVPGRAGARQWINDAAVFKVLAAAQLDKGIYLSTPDLLSPTQIEKKIKKTHPQVWGPLSGMVKQAEGGPSVAPMSDPRPTWAGASFDGEDYDASDLV